MFQAQNRETINSALSCYVLQDHYDDERDNTVFHSTTPDLQDQDRDQDQDRFFWSQTSLVLRPTVSDHITVKMTTIRYSGYVHNEDNAIKCYHDTMARPI